MASRVSRQDKAEHIIWGSIDRSANIHNVEPVAQKALLGDVQFMENSSSSFSNSSEKSQERRLPKEQRGVISEQVLLQEAIVGGALEPEPEGRSVAAVFGDYMDGGGDYTWMNMDDEAPPPPPRPGTALGSSGSAGAPSAGSSSSASPERVARINANLREALGGTGDMWSMGTEYHVMGTCKSCHYVYSSGGCERGPSCTFCHIPHTNPDLSKVAQNRRTYCKRFAAALYHRHHTEADKFCELSAVVSTRSDFMRGLLQPKVDELTRPGFFRIPPQVRSEHDGAGAASTSSRAAASSSSSQRPPDKIIMSL